MNPAQPRKRSHRFVDLTGTRVGRWTVVSLDESRQGAFWHCVCDCGTKAIKESNKLRGHSLSCGCRRREGINRPRGEAHPLWNPNLTPKDRKQSRDARHYRWRDAVLERDGHKCQISGLDASAGPLCAHHIEPWADRPESRYDVGNGITMLASLHVIFHRMFGQKGATRSDLEQFRRWMELVDVASVVTHVWTPEERVRYGPILRSMGKKRERLRQNRHDKRARKQQQPLIQQQPSP